MRTVPGECYASMLPEERTPPRSFATSVRQAPDAFDLQTIFQHHTYFSSHAFVQKSRAKLAKQVRAKTIRLVVEKTLVNTSAVSSLI